MGERREEGWWEIESRRRLRESILTLKVMVFT